MLPLEFYQKLLISILEMLNYRMFKLNPFSKISLSGLLFIIFQLFHYRGVLPVGIYLSGVFYKVVPILKSFSCRAPDWTLYNVMLNVIVPENMYTPTTQRNSRGVRMWKAQEILEGRGERGGQLYYRYM